MNKKNLKVLIIVVWILLLIFVVWKFISLQIPISDYPRVLANFINQFGWWAPLFFILLFVIRPFIFFPATILSVSVGLLFGATKAILILVVAENLSAYVSYNIGKYFGKDILSKFGSNKSFVKSFEKYFQQNDFIAILCLRLVFAPFDFVGYVAGASSIKYKSFALATFIGIIPGLLLSAFLGGSFANPYYFFVVIFLFLSTLLLSKFIKKKYTI